VVVLGDGAEWIWNRAQELFPQAIQILDLYHTMEHIWDVARQLYGGAGKQKDKGATRATRKQAEKDRKTDLWAFERIAELKQGNISAIISNLRKRRPRRTAAQESCQ
jgi:transposase